MDNAMGYQATLSGETLTVHDVPVFCECSREHKGEVIVFDGKWIGRAVKKAMQKRGEAYLPPLNLYHHDDAGKSEVVNVGVFEVTRTGLITLDGKRKIAVFADLHIKKPEFHEDIIKGNFPYRSVEIFKIDKPNLNVLSLLDDDPPYLELPMLMVSHVDEKVAGATFKAGGRLEWSHEDDVVLASFSSGQRAQLLFSKRLAMADEVKDDDKTEEQKALFQEDPPEKKKDDDDSVDMEGDGEMDVKPIIAAVKSGKIQAGALAELKDAILEFESSIGGEEATPEEEDMPAPAAVPGEVMKASPEDSVGMAALKGEVMALKAQAEARAEADAIKEDVSVAMKRLEGRPMGSDLNTELTTFRREHGPKAFKALVDSYVEKVGILPDADGRGEMFSAQQGTSEVAMKYGTRADEAAKFSRQYREQKERGLPLSMDEARYVELNMNGRTING